MSTYFQGNALFLKGDQALGRKKKNQMACKLGNKEQRAYLLNLIDLQRRAKETGKEI